MHFDLIVIGIGLSGLMAAKTAAVMGKRVLIVGKGMGTLCLFSNTVDLLGSLPNSVRMKEGLSQWIKDYPYHPYSKVGIERIEEALASFLSLFPPPYSFQSMEERNCMLPTGAGTLRPTYLIPNTMMAGTTLKDRDGLIVGFRGFKDFYANYAADQLGCQGINLSLSEAYHREISAPALARLMERESFREMIGREIKRHLVGETPVGLPAILGIQDSCKVKEDLEQIIGAEVFEIPILPPSIPGLRIFNRFKEWLIQRGVSFLLGAAILKVVLKENRCEGVCIANPPIFNSYSADRYILATGRLIGGGLVAGEEKISEPIFGLPVVQPRLREDWFGKEFFNFFDCHPKNFKIAF